MEIKVTNVNRAFSEIFWQLKALDLQPEQTRNGPALVFPEPVIITYRYPTERVLFEPARDANPIFHLMESIWMLAGRKDVAFLKQFNSRMSDFSDDGATFNAAYGHRWRNHFGHDQLDEVVRLLRRDPKTRQAVIQMWDSADLQKDTKDKACNTQLVFDTRGDKLNMSVFNRSNDIWWGALGANVVHFSVLQEFVATALKLPVGVYRQISNNLHLYTELYDVGNFLKFPPVVEEYDLYAEGLAHPYPMMVDNDYRTFLMECELFCADPFNERLNYHNPFFDEVARPMAMVSRVRKEKVGDGRAWIRKIKASDWQSAATMWVANREFKKNLKI
jgi:hypothetical protein